MTMTIVIHKSVTVKGVLLWRFPRDPNIRHRFAKDHSKVQVPNLEPYRNGKWQSIPYYTEGKLDDTSGFDGIVDGALDSTVGILSELSDTLGAVDGIIDVVDSDGRAEGMSDDIIDGSS
jgi:hypothetical protein